MALGEDWETVRQPLPAFRVPAVPRRKDEIVRLGSTALPLHPLPGAAGEDNSGPACCGERPWVAERCPLGAGETKAQPWAPLPARAVGAALRVRSAGDSRLP